MSSHLSASTISSVSGQIMTCQCMLSSAISVVIWFLAIILFTRSPHLSFCLPRFRFHLLSSVGPMPVSSFSRSRHLSFGLPRFRFPYTVIYRASYNDLFLTNTFCPHKPSRRWAWHSPNGKTHNQIDYIMVKKRFRSSVNINRTRILTHH